MTTCSCNFQYTSLLLSTVVRVQSKQDKQGYKEMKGHMLLQLMSDQKNTGLKKQQKPLLINNALYASKLQNCVEGLLFQNIPKLKNHPC